MIVIDWSAIERQRTEQRLRASMERGPDDLQREMRRNLRKMERARKRGVFTPTPRSSSRG
jgi:hypothetical protein